MSRWPRNHGSLGAQHVEIARRLVAWRLLSGGRMRSTIGLGLVCLFMSACAPQGLDGIACGLDLGLAPADRSGESGLVEAQISCSGFVLFGHCSPRKLAVGTAEEVRTDSCPAQQHTGAVMSSNPVVLAADGFTGSSERTFFMSGTIVAQAPGVAALEIRDEDGATFDRIAFEVEEPAVLESIPLPSPLAVGGEALLLTNVLNAAGEGLHASTGYRWTVDPPGIIELTSSEDDTRDLRLVRGIAPGLATVTIAFGALSTSTTITVTP